MKVMILDKGNCPRLEVINISGVDVSRAITRTHLLLMINKQGKTEVERVEPGEKIEVSYD
jgi:hypothetical protein